MQECRPQPQGPYFPWLPWCHHGQRLRCLMWGRLVIFLWNYTGAADLCKAVARWWLQQFLQGVCVFVLFMQYPEAPWNREAEFICHNQHTTPKLCDFLEGMIWYITVRGMCRIGLRIFWDIGRSTCAIGWSGCLHFWQEQNPKLCSSPEIRGISTSGMERPGMKSQDRWNCWHFLVGNPVLVHFPVSSENRFCRA